jgi:polar amino acid transport system permease protein
MSSSDNALQQHRQKKPLLLAITREVIDLPWWLVIAILLGLLVLWAIVSDETYTVIFDAVREGVYITIYVTLIGYAASVIVGLLVGLARISKNPILHHLSSFYVEIIRGVPMLVLLYYIALVVVPASVDGLNALGGWMIEQNVLVGLGANLAEMGVRDLDFTFRVIVALTIGYSAFISEIFRAGIESIEPGQMDAARSLGATYFQAMRHVILPQAIRRVLPPLGNDFIAMLKDSSLVSVFGVRDITLQGKVYSASTFRFFQTYNVVAFLYLVMTIVLSLLVRYLERRMSSDRRAES